VSDKINVDAYQVLLDFIEKRVKERTEDLENKLREAQNQNELAKQIADLVMQVRKHDLQLIQKLEEIASLLEVLLKKLNKKFEYVA